MIKTTAIYVPGAPRRKHPPMYEMVDAEPHSQHNQDRMDDYHENIASKPNKASGVDSTKRINELNPTKTLPQASTVNTETMGPG